MKKFQPAKDISEGIQDLSNNIPHYANELASRSHVNFLSLGEVSKNVGPVVVSIENTDKQTPKKAIIMSKKGNQRMIVPENIENGRDALKYIQTKKAELAPLNFTKVLHAWNSSNLSLIVFFFSILGGQS